MSKPGASDSLSSLWLLLKRLVMPSLFFLFFLGFLISHDDLIEKFTGNVSEVVMVSVRYGSQIGLWLSATFLVQRLITVFVWDGLIAGISGRPVPSLPKDVTAMILFGFRSMFATRLILLAFAFVFLFFRSVIPVRSMLFLPVLPTGF